MKNKILSALLISIMFVPNVSAAVNVTTTMQTIWDLIDNVVDNTDSIVGLFIIGVILTVMYAVGRFITKTLQKNIE